MTVRTSNTLHGKAQRDPGLHGKATRGARNDHAPCTGWPSETSSFAANLSGNLPLNLN